MNKKTGSVVGLSGQLHMYILDYSLHITDEPNIILGQVREKKDYDRPLVRVVELNERITPFCTSPSSTSEQLLLSDEMGDDEQF